MATFPHKAAHLIIQTYVAGFVFQTASRGLFLTAITGKPTAAQAATLPTVAELAVAGLTKRSATTRYNAMASGGRVTQAMPSLTALITKCTAVLLISLTTGVVAATSASRTTRTIAAAAA